MAWVPGAFEIPLVARRFAERGDIDAVICLGAVIRGETAHFDLIADTAAHGIAEVGRSTGVPCIFEVLATDDLAQARGARRRRARQQGLGGGVRRGRDGPVAPSGLRGRPHVIVDRPWGRTQTYALNQPATARLVTVVPGGDTGAHYHRLRDELWIVLDAGLTIEIGNRVLEPVPGDELQVPAEEPHRIRCGPDGPGRILQIAFGYASEDDRLPVDGASAPDV